MTHSRYPAVHPPRDQSHTSVKAKKPVAMPPAYPAVVVSFEASGHEADKRHEQCVKTTEGKRRHAVREATGPCAVLCGLRRPSKNHTVVSAALADVTRNKSVIRNHHQQQVPPPAMTATSTAPVVPNGVASSFVLPAAAGSSSSTTDRVGERVTSTLGAPPVHVPVVSGVQVTAARSAELRCSKAASELSHLLDIVTTDELSIAENEASSSSPLGGHQHSAMTMPRLASFDGFAAPENSLMFAPPAPSPSMMTGAAADLTIVTTPHSSGCAAPGNRGCGAEVGRPGLAPDDEVSMLRRAVADVGLRAAPALISAQGTHQDTHMSARPAEEQHHRVQGHESGLIDGLTTSGRSHGSDLQRRTAPRMARFPLQFSG